MREKQAKRVLVEAPDGLKPLIPCLLEKLSGKYEFIISGLPTYGSCDIALDEARKLGVDAIVHIGHNEYPFLSIKPEIPVLYVPVYYNWVPGKQLIERLDNMLRGKYRKIGVVSTIQHLNIIKTFERELERKGYDIYVGKPSTQLMPGQILGCEYSAALDVVDRVDVFLVIAGGRFHAIGLSLVVDKPIIQIDPYREELIDLGEKAKRIIAKRYYVVSMVRNTRIKTMGVIIGSKPGQYRPGIIDFVKKILAELGIEFYDIVVDELSFERLVSIDNAFKADAYVVTSCPRLPIDDLSDFYKPVLTPGELYMVRKNRLDKYVFPWYS